MGLYFALHPNELRGNVLELGSGVGLGGILCNAATNINNANDTVTSAKRSVTLTDVNDDVLDMLQKNMDSAAKSSCNRVRGDISIQKLDWFDFLGDNTQPNSSDQYNTIIASDCAYLHSQIAPLSETILKLLGNEHMAKLHMFAPYNRGALYELIEELHLKDMHVVVEEIELSKYRIKQGRCTDIVRELCGWNVDTEQVQDMTCSESKFLHITAWHKTEVEMYANLNVPVPISDID